MTAQVTIITPTFNKPTYFAQCVESVLAQTYQDWVWWVVLNPTMRGSAEYPADISEVDLPFVDYFKGDISCIWKDQRIVPIFYYVDHWMRTESHITPCIVNWLYPKVQTPYIYFLADDDLIDKDGLTELVKHIDRLKDWNDEVIKFAPIKDAVYGRCEVQDEQPDGSFKTGSWCYEGTDVGLGTGIEPDCKLDSSQILHTKALWDRATADGWQLSDNLHDGAHADGLLLNRLAQFARFHYVPQRINIHRRTRLSTWHKPQV